VWTNFSFLGLKVLPDCRVNVLFFLLICLSVLLVRFILSWALMQCMTFFSFCVYFFNYLLQCWLSGHRRSLLLLQFQSVTLLGTGVWLAVILSQGLKHISPCCAGLQGFCWEVCCHPEEFAFVIIWLVFLAASSILSLFCTLGILIVIRHGETLFWSCVFGVLNALWT
jgi:hypothetical protein